MFSKDDSEKLAEKLAKLATLAEELSAEFFQENKEHSETYNKIQLHARKHATCLRMHNQLPLKRENKIKQAIKTFDSAVKTFQSAKDFMGDRRE